MIDIHVYDSTGKFYQIHSYLFQNYKVVIPILSKKPLQKTWNYRFPASYFLLSEFLNVPPLSRKSSGQHG